MVKLVIEIPDELKELGEALATMVARVQVDLPTFGEGGPQPGVDLDDSAALLDLQEGRDAAD